MDLNTSEMIDREMQVLRRLAPNLRQRFKELIAELKLNGVQVEMVYEELVRRVFGKGSAWSPEHVLDILVVELRGNSDLSSFKQELLETVSTPLESKPFPIRRDDIKPVYCSLMVQRRCEVSYEGWLVMTSDPAIYYLQPAVAYEPDGLHLGLAVNDILSITPTYPPEPYQITAAKVEPLALDGLNVERHNLSEYRDEIAKMVIDAVDGRLV